MNAQNFQTEEECPHCGTEQNIDSQIAGACPNCGNTLVACSVCKATCDQYKNHDCSGCVKGSKWEYATLPKI